jgi:glycosyltransferase involved in cell wall biosynthesis
MVARMRVLFIIHELALNGAVTALLRQARHMIARGDQVTVATPELEGPAAALLPQFQEAGIDVVRTVPWAQHDITVGCTVFCGAVLHGCIGKTPTAWWIHEGRVGVTMLMSRPAARNVLQNVGRLIFPSAGVVERLWSPLIGNLPPGRVEVIPPLVPPPPQVEPMPKTPGHARVVCVGSIYPRKRQVDLLRAVAMLRGVPVECVLIGPRVSLEAPGDDIVASDPQRFILPGGQMPDEVHRWYRSADVFSLPSGDESMPISPIEAAQQNVPVVLTDLECYERIWRHGVNALIHPVGDVDMLAWYLRMLIESPRIRGRLVTAARSVALRFSEQRAGALFDAALAETVAAFR